MSQYYSHSYPGYDQVSVETAISALMEGNFSGRETKAEAEKQLATFTGSPYSKLTNSGFSALQASLIGIGVTRGQEVVIPTITCPSVYHAVSSIGATPIVVDVNTDLPLISLEETVKAKKMISGHAVVIIPHMFGLSQDVLKFKSNGFTVIEDMAQRFVPKLDSNAEIAVVSFSPTKLFTIGYGGGVITRDIRYIQRITSFLDPDYNESNNDEELPFRIHAPISDYQSSMLISQLTRYWQIIRYREKLVEIYDQSLQFRERLNPTIPFRYQLILNNDSAEEVSRVLRAHKIGAWALGSHLIHNTLNLKGRYENAEWWSKRVLSLPLHENLNEQDVRLISEIVRRYI